MTERRAFQNPYLGRHLGVRNIQPLQKEKNILAAKRLALVEKAVEERKEIVRTFDPKTGRARYSRYEVQVNYPSGSKHTVLQCIQMVTTLPLWRRLLVPFIGEYCKIGGVKYLMVGQTNILYRAQEWIAGRARKSTLRVV